MSSMKAVKKVLIGVFSLLAVLGLLTMSGMLVWAFQLAKDLTGRYETAAFIRHFWNLFDTGAGLWLLASLGFSGTLKSRTAVRGGIAAFVLGLMLFINLVPFVDFEDWSGAAAYTMIFVVFTGAFVMSVTAGIKWFSQKFRARPFTG
jgi:hypothetical protein